MKQNMTGICPIYDAYNSWQCPVWFRRLIPLSEQYNCIIHCSNYANLTTATEETRSLTWQCPRCGSAVGLRGQDLLVELLDRQGVEDQVDDRRQAAGKPGLSQPEAGRQKVVGRSPPGNQKRKNLKTRADLFSGLDVELKQVFLDAFAVVVVHVAVAVVVVAVVVVDAAAIPAVSWNSSVVPSLLPRSQKTKVALKTKIIHFLVCWKLIALPVKFWLEAI